MTITIGVYKPLVRRVGSRPGGVDHPATQSLISFEVRFLTRKGAVAIDFGELKDLISYQDSHSIDGASGSWSLRMKALLSNEEVLKKLHPGCVAEFYACRNDDPLIGVNRKPSEIERIDNSPDIKLAEIAVSQTLGTATAGALSSSANSGLSARRRAFLDTIAYAEGTDRYPNSGYQTMFTGAQFSGNRHPRQINSGGGYSSDAAGRYQFLSTTWDGLGLPDFSPANQDLGALRLVEQEGALGDVDAGNFDAAARKVANVWASFPGAGYDQPERALSELRSVYQQAYTRYSTGQGSAPTPATAITSPSEPIMTTVASVAEIEPVKPAEDYYLDKCPYLLLVGITVSHGRSTSASGETELTVSGESFGAIFKDAQTLTDMRSPELATRSFEVRQSTLYPDAVQRIYYRLLKDWVENFWGQPTGWEVRTRPIPFPPNYLTRFNSEGAVWNNLQYLAISGVFHLFCDHTGALCWEKLPWSGTAQALIDGRNWEDLELIELPSYVIVNWSDTIDKTGIANFLRFIPTQQGVSGGSEPISEAAAIYNMGSIRQYGGPIKREFSLPVGTSNDEWYTSEPRRKEQATIFSFTSLVALECARWYDRPLHRVSISVMGDACYRVGVRLKLTENWHNPEAKPGEYYITSRSHNINLEQGRWTTTMQLVRDRRTRYLGIGVGDVPIITDNTRLTDNSETIDALAEAGRLGLAGNRAAAGNLDLFTDAIDEFYGTYKPDLGLPLAPDEYWFYDRLQGQFVLIGNDPIGYGKKYVVPRLGEQSKPITLQSPTAQTGAPSVGGIGQGRRYTVATDYFIDGSPAGSQAHDLTLIDPQTDSVRVDIPSPVSGTVTSVDYSPGGYGHLVVVRDDATGQSWLLAHMAIPSVAVGQRVRRGQTLGIQGSTGNSTGEHVHVEVLKPGYDGYGKSSPYWYPDRSVTQPLVERWVESMRSGVY